MLTLGEKDFASAGDAGGGHSQGFLAQIGSDVESPRRVSAVEITAARVDGLYHFTAGGEVVPAMMDLPAEGRRGRVRPPSKIWRGADYVPQCSERLTPRPVRNLSERRPSRLQSRRCGTVLGGQGPRVARVPPGTKVSGGCRRAGDPRFRSER